MDDFQLGTLERIDAREVWKNEARHFTPWLRENIDLLGEALGLEIDPDVQREVAVGLFSADLLGSDLATKAGILVENQLEATDHDHLGKLLTYAGGLGVDVLVWLSPAFREEHKQALTWLNERTHDDVYFFGVEIELLRIGASLPAPNFKVVVSPNEWQKSQAGRVATSGNGSELRERYRMFWESLIQEVRERDPKFTWSRPERAPRQSWISFTAGGSGFQDNLSFGFEGGDRVLRAELYIDHGDQARNKMAFDALLAMRDAIEVDLGESLVWTRRDDIQASRVYMTRPGTIHDPPEALDEHRRWGVDRLFAIRRVFGPRVVALNLDETPMPDSVEGIRDGSPAELT